MPLHTLRSKRPYRKTTPCYLCGASAPKGGHTRDHVPPRWIYEVADGKPANWPTCPLCERCRLVTDPAEAELRLAASVAGGANATGWRTLKRGFDRDQGVLNTVLQRTVPVQVATAAGPADAVALRSNDQLMESGLTKLGAGLHWLIFGERLSEGARVMTLVPRLDGAVAAYAFGPAFLVVLHEASDAPDLKILEVLIFNRALFRIACVPARLVGLLYGEPTAG